jgi:CRISPR/Cas system CMR subunit Cmr6 (Cas7 group RAMP superfamily)
MDLNPVALAPSASIPHIPYTDLKEILKIYGEAEVTVSDTSDREDPETEGNASVGAF